MQRNETPTDNVLPMHRRPLRLLRRKEVEERTGLGEWALDELERAGQFPKRVKVTPRAVAWVEHEVEAFIAQRIAERDNDKPTRHRRP